MGLVQGDFVSCTYRGKPRKERCARGAGRGAEDARGGIFIRWPWMAPVQWCARRLLSGNAAAGVAAGAPRVTIDAPRAETLAADGPLLIVANHVSTFDGPLIEYALPGALRRRIAVAMSGEMLDDYRHFRNPETLQPSGWFFLPGPLFYFLLTALFNVFPLPRRRDFQPSFAHAGQAMDRASTCWYFLRAHGRQRASWRRSAQG